MAETNSKNQTSMMALLVTVLLLTFVGAGVGLVAGAMLQPEEDGASQAIQTPQNDPAVKAEQTAKPDYGSDHKADAEAEGPPELPETEAVAVKPVPFPPVLTMVANPKGTWIRIEGTMLVSEHADEKPEILVEQAATNILSYLRSVELQQIEGPSGLLYFRDDINTLVSSLSEGQITEVLIHSLVIE